MDRIKVVVARNLSEHPVAGFADELQIWRTPGLRLIEHRLNTNTENLVRFEARDPIRKLVTVPPPCSLGDPI